MKDQKLNDVLERENLCVQWEIQKMKIVLRGKIL